ncbi:MAG: hypothetical protein NTW96_25670 [Planctomycetia bacterium]|nr:hypothetical protein [Planctomycetia bacterium]
MGATLAANATVLPQSSLSGDGWRILDQAVVKVLDKLDGAGKQLSTVVNGLFYGIKTGCNEVFEIDEETRRDLVEQDTGSAEIVRPWLRGRNVGRWSVQWGGRFLVFTRRGIQIDRYPAIKRYLARHRPRLEPRPRNIPAKNWAGRKPGTYKWYEVQDAIDYWQELVEGEPPFPPNVIEALRAASAEWAATPNPEPAVIDATTGDVFADWDDAPLPPEPCPNCGSILRWWNVLGDERCIGCDPPTRGLRFLQHVKRIRQRYGR